MRVVRKNLDKVLWPDAGVTKGEMLDHLDAVRDLMLAELRGRPLTVVRAPDGIAAQTFFQKNAPKHTPEWVDTVTLPAPSAKRDVRYIVCNDADTLEWLGNQASVEFHVTPARVPQLDRPDIIAFDMDPPEGRFDLAVAAALAVRAALREAGVDAGVKTTGGKGLHVVVPIERRYAWEDVWRTTDAVARRVTELEPALFTDEFKKAERGERVLFDVGRNALGATLVSAYSPRARPGATVSFPVTWDELERVDPAAYTVRTAAGLLGAAGVRVWTERMADPQRLPATLTSG